MPEKFEGGVQPQEDAEKESIQPVLQVLKETAEKFRSLNQEAKEALQAKRDVATYRQKLEERKQNMDTEKRGDLERTSPIEPKEKPGFLFHGTDNPDIKEFEPRKRLIPGGTGRDVPARVYAGDNPAFASAFSFPWIDEEGFELSFDSKGLVVFRVPINEKHRLQQKVYLYKIASRGFEPTEGEGTGHSYHIEKKVIPQERITFNNVEEAIRHFGGTVEYYDLDAEAKAKEQDKAKIAEIRNSLGLK